MKVIILGTAWPYRGGLAAFNERLARQYQREGHEVEVVTFTLQYPKLLFPGKTQYSDEPAPEGLKITRKLNAINPFSWIATGRYIKKQRPDLVVTKFWLPFMAPALGVANRTARAKWKDADGVRRQTRRISILDNLVPHEKRPGDKFFARFFVRSVDGMVAMSRSVLADADLFDPRHRKPRTFCPHPLYDHYGAALSRKEALDLIGLREAQRYVLFFGFIRDYKGLDLLLDAMADERMERLGVKLIVAGEFYGDPKPYHEQIARLDIGDRVAMHTDFIPDHEVNRYFCAADLVAQPYKTATQSGVTQISFHFERQMLVTNVGGLPEIVPDGKVGFVVESRADRIADAIVRYFEEDWQQRLAEGVRQEKKKYAWENMTRAIAGLQ
ncbi:MAG: glycosyltransferase [Bacteroidales bacterium]|nr:glycosyltransferase [Bacteroidales bacterium]